MAEKTNIQYLREAIAEARFEEVDRLITEIEDDIFNKNAEVSALKSRIKQIKENEYKLPRTAVIDCGIGVIKYVVPDNLQLQIRMESIKEQMQNAALH